MWQRAEVGVDLQGQEVCVWQGAVHRYWGGAVVVLNYEPFTFQSETSEGFE